MTLVFFNSSSQLSSLKKDLSVAQENVANWLKANKLTLNVNKKPNLLFNLGGNRTKEKLNIHVNTKEL